MPAFLASDDLPDTGGDGLLSGVNVRRRRRQYDERPDEDDVEEDVSINIKDRMRASLMIRKCPWNTLAMLKPPVLPNGCLSRRSDGRCRNTSGVS